MLSQLRNTLLLSAILLSGYGISAQAPAPAAYPNDIPVNFVRVWEARAPQTNPNKILSTSPLDSFLMTTQYFDGLGRPLQTVVKGITPSGRDLVTPVLYDEAGRVQLSYLPFAANSAGGNSSVSDGQFKYNSFEQDSAFYSSSNPQSPVYGQQESWIYSQTVYEPSPLNRVSASYAPGNNWVGAQRGVARQYQINTVSDSVRIWEPDSTTAGIPTSPGCYGAGQLYKNVSIDENDKQVVEYVDKQGRVLLKKLQLADTPGTAHVGWLCTYYVYDDLSNLRFVIPPAAVEALLQSGSFSMSNAIRDGYCFYYGYDCRQRMVCKKVPGATEVWMVYDKRDRLCMTQDGNMRNDTARWLVTLYDDLNRPVATGLWTDGNDRAYHDSLAAAGSAYYYPFQSPPASDWELLTQTGYDDYSTLPSGAPTGSLYSAGITSDQFYTSGFNTAATGYAQPITQSVQTMGLVTWSAVRVLGSTNFLYTVNIYDEKGRVIQTKSTNITGGSDVTTMQYDFSGKLLRTQTRQEKGGSSPHHYQLLTKNHYDAAGRLLSVSKQVSLDNETPAADKTIVAMRYDELGQLSEKTLGAGLDSLQYDYNIRGWLLGANRDYARQEESSGHYFGFDLGYDKTTIQSGAGTIGSYSRAAYNGNIAGMLWKSAGDGALRKYDFSYDAVNRLKQAAFTQYSAGSFNLSEGIDFSVSGISYDANGNILQLSRRGWKAAGSSNIDSLLYSYEPMSNRLRNVIDRVNDPQTVLGDFRSSALYMTALGTKTTDATDYSYDDNGNMIRDLNKDIGSASTQGIRYNYLNLPREITVYKTADSIKGTIEYVYDAAGNKLQKIVNENGRPAKTTLYLGGSVWENDSLQFIAHEEGRIRWAQHYRLSGDSSYGWEYDYFIKDHLGNVRMLLTEQHDTTLYLASMEQAYRSREDSLFSHIDETAYSTALVPGGYPATDATTSPNDYVARVSGSGNSIGPSLVLKVMAGDELDLGVKYFYRDHTVTEDNRNILSDLLSSLASGIVSVAGSSKGSLTELSGPAGPLAAAFNSFRSEENPDPSGKPKAFLNWILLDEQFQYVSGSSGAKAVNQPDVIDSLLIGSISMKKNGYLYIYVSNETENWDVFFDNLVVQHRSGPLLEETHYYPFGLTMAGISLTVLRRGDAENKYKYNGIEQNTELDLNQYDAFYRNLDPQIGRFWQIDPESEDLSSTSPYESMGNNPIDNVDPLGDFRTRFGAWLHKIFYGGEIAQNKWGEYYVIKTIVGNSDGDVTITGKVSYGKGRDKYSTLKERLNDELDEQNTRDRLTREGIWDPNLSADEAKANTVTLGLALIASGESIKSITNVVNSLTNPKGVSVPKGWIRKATKKGDGIKYVDPKNPHNNIRQMPGNPNSPNPAQRNPYVIFKKNGVAYDVNGIPLKSANDAAAHIPLKQFDMSKMPKF